MNFIEILTIINAVGIVFLAFWLKFMPNNRNLQSEVREQGSYLEDELVRIDADIDDLRDLIDNYIAKWSNRETTRATRAKEKDLKDDNPLNKKGMISPSDLKKYGITK